jgi:proton-dependent oligopeptide transporter, POT family
MFFGLLQYIWDGKKYLPEGSLTPDDPLTEAEKKTVIKWAAVIVIALVAVLGAHGCLPQLQR